MTNLIITFFLLHFLNLSSAGMASDSQPLKLNIQLDQESFTVGQGILLSISLSNVGNTIVNVPEFFLLPSDDPAKNNLYIMVYDSSGQRIARISHTMTGRAIYYPYIQTIPPGESYNDIISLAGTFVRKIKRKKTVSALWCFGENPEILLANEYPPVQQGTFTVQVIYQVNEKNLVTLEQEKKKEVWQGTLHSNIVKFSIH